MFYIIKPTHQKKVYVARALINRATELSIMCECHSATYAEAIVEALNLQEALKSADRTQNEAGNWPGFDSLKAAKPKTTKTRAT